MLQFEQAIAWLAASPLGCVALGLVVLALLVLFERQGGIEDRAMVRGEARRDR